MALIADIEVDVAQVLEELGVEATGRSRGSWVDTLCPFHPERNPSFSINLEHGGWIDRHTGETGELVGLIAALLEVDRAGAISWLRERKVGTAESTPALLSRLFAVTDGDSEAAEALHEWSLVYDALSPTKMEQYFFSRGFTVATMRKFEVRYDENDDSLIFPVRDERANLVGYVRRRVDRGIAFRRKYLYPFGFRRTLYPLHLYRGDAPLLVEGPLDAMWLHQCGYENGLAMLGSDMISEQREWLRAHAIRVTLCLDNDASGRRSTKTLVQRLICDHDVWVARLPVGVKDIQEVAPQDIPGVISEARQLILPSDL